MALCACQFMASSGSHAHHAPDVGRRRAVVRVKCDRLDALVSCFRPAPCLARQGARDAENHSRTRARRAAGSTRVPSVIWISRRQPRLLYRHSHGDLSKGKAYVRQGAGIVMVRTRRRSAKKPATGRGAVARAGTRAGRTLGNHGISVDDCRWKIGTLRNDASRQGMKPAPSSIQSSIWDIFNLTFHYPRCSMVFVLDNYDSLCLQPRAVPWANWVRT